jgi:hypothetical protein
VHLLWCIGGDFNVTRFPSERSGDVHFCPAMVEFLDFIFVQSLMDIPLVGGNFTWSNNRDPPSWSRIDRFLVSPDWEAQFPKVSQKRRQRLCLDYFLILLDRGDFHGGKRHFKFENVVEIRGFFYMLFTYQKKKKLEGFVERVKQWWSSYRFQGPPSFILALKVKALKVDLKVWNDEVFGNVERQKKFLLDELQDLDLLEEQRTLCDEEKVRKAKATDYLERSTLVEEVSWR